MGAGGRGSVPGPRAAGIIDSATELPVGCADDLSAGEDIQGGARRNVAFGVCVVLVRVPIVCLGKVYLRVLFVWVLPISRVSLVEVCLFQRLCLAGCLRVCLVEDCLS